MDQADDLKAFERRMTEIVSSLRPSIWRWRLILIILILLTLTTFYALITDLSFSLSTTATTTTISFESSISTINNRQSHISIFFSNFFRKEILFSISLVLLISAFLFGIHRRIFASSIILSRFRYILDDYNMSCDSDGRLIIKPRSTTYTIGES